MLRSLTAGLLVVAGMALPRVEASTNDVPAITTETQKASNPMVILKTSKGDITLELFEKEAPETVANFLAYVDSGFYKGTIFHRVIEGFMIQGGGFTRDMNQKPTRAPIKNEAANGLKKRPRHPGHGSHPGSQQRHRAVFHQRGQQ
jgi:cyclophilin family peptidyl-prolyl cis-trans isomerase